MITPRDSGTLVRLLTRISGRPFFFDNSQIPPSYKSHAAWSQYHFALSKANILEGRANPNTLAILRINRQLYTEARQSILENKIIYLDINEVTRNFKGTNALVKLLHRVFQTRHLHFTVVLMPPSLRTNKGKYDYNCLQLVLETFSKDRKKHQKVKSQMHVEITVACERNKEATAIWRTARLAFKYNKRPGVDFSIRIAASKICRYAAYTLAELRHHQKMLSDAVAGFEKLRIRACVVDITKEPWF